MIANVKNIPKASVAILEQMTYGILALHGDDGYPYSVPVNYVYSDGRIYFHCAPEGHKIDAIMHDAKVSFCVVERDDVVSSEFSTRYRSVIIFGKARILTDEAEKWAALNLLGNRFSPDELDLETKKSQGFNRLLMVEIKIEHLTGKESKKLAMERQSRQ